jgi:catechol 2,3-dioxygenase
VPDIKGIQVGQPDHGAIQYLREGIRGDQPMKAFRLPGETHISQIWLQTTNLARTLRFYEDALNFKTIKHGGRHAGLSTTGNWPPQIILTQIGHEALAHKPPLKPQLFAVRFPTVKCLVQTHRRLQSLLIPMHGPLHQEACISLFLGSPDEYVVELYADILRSPWRRHNGTSHHSNTPWKVSESFGATDLPANDLVMLSERSIGHIDLHVYNLEKAKRSYCDFLGLTVTDRVSDCLRLAAGSYHRHFTLRKLPGNLTATRTMRDLVRYRLNVPGMETVHELQDRVGAFGYERRLQQFSPGALSILDPCGCTLQIQSEDCGDHVHERELNVCA